MKNIHFENFDNRKNSTARKITAISVIIFIGTIGFLMMYDEKNQKIYQATVSIASFSFVLFTVGRSFIRPNYVGWSANSLIIRLGFWKFPKGIEFDEVIEVTQSDQKIIFWKRYDEQVEIDLKDYSTDDIEKFKQILSENLRSKAHFKGKPSWIQSQKLTS